MLTKFLVGLRAPGVSIDDNFLRQKIFLEKIEKAGVRLFLCQISARTNNDDGKNLL